MPRNPEGDDPLAPLTRLPVLDAARWLLGKTLVRHVDGQRLAGRIVETEAYHQEGDEACHAFRGRTQRNAVMFGPPGRLYVYFIYGMHHCMNVVVEPEGVGAAVLIRALEPLEGLEAMRRRRGPRIAPRDTANGPAKACQALGVDRALDGADLLAGPEIRLEDGPAPKEREIVAATRIGIAKSAHLPWRFYWKNNPHISKK